MAPEPSWRSWSARRNASASPQSEIRSRISAPSTQRCDPRWTSVHSAFHVPSRSTQPKKPTDKERAKARQSVTDLATKASRDGKGWRINGSKIYITNGHRADFIVLVTKTDKEAGYDGFTLFLVDMDAPGVIREKRLQKLGMHASDTALLAFQDVRVPP